VNQVPEAMSDDDILPEFIIEAREILDQLDIDFVKLEEAPEDNKIIRNVFRAVHTLKGNSGFFGFKRLEKVCHAAEALLGKLRDSVIVLDEKTTTSLLQTLDILRVIIEGIEKNHTEPDGEDSQLIEILGLLAKANISKNQTKVDNSENNLLTSSAHEDHVILLNTSFSESLAHPQEIKGIYSESEHQVGVHVQEWHEIEPAHPLPFEAGEPVNKHHDVVPPVKVNLELLDTLMSLVSEMVLARNRLLPFSEEFGNHRLSSAIRSIDLLTLELQENMLKTRMQPISQVWSKFPRLVRDVAHKCNKKVKLIQEGTETELDRGLLDAISDPLVHMIRNSIDHGLESPSERLKQGKSETGYVLLKANHENGLVVISISDDGAGIDIDSVRTKAVEKKLITAQQAQTFEESKILDLLFTPGFSTKETVSNLSGRGVGMDVVKTNISKIGGSIDIESLRGKGTTIRIRIPLTLAIMSALFVRSNQERFAIPQSSILELVRLDLSMGDRGLEDFYGTAVFRLRNSLVPLIHLHQQLELQESHPDASDVINIVILQSSGVRYGLVVDEVLNIEEIVVKPLGPMFEDLNDFGGATILGDGRAALILDVDGIAMESGLVAKMQSKPLIDQETISRVNEEEVSMLLFELEGLNNLAIPLNLVHRLLIIRPEQIQKNGNRNVIQFGSHIMELLYLDAYVSGAKSKKWKADESIPVIVHYINAIPIGLVVSQVHDVVNTTQTLQETTPPQKGLLGCISEGNRIINVINIDEIMGMHRMFDVKTQYSVLAQLSAPE
jgi:two-component system chemotaxis sensor kinase CheA